jgi:hypothetical protein
MRDLILAADVTLDCFMAGPANKAKLEVLRTRSFPSGTGALVYRTRTL